MLKVKRDVLEAKYADVIAALYARIESRRWPASRSSAACLRVRMLPTRWRSPRTLTHTPRASAVHADQHGDFARMSHTRPASRVQA
jgi:hypothetical protein